MRFSHKTLILFSSLIWVVSGISLLSTGIYFVLETVRSPALAQIHGHFSITHFFTYLVKDRTQALLLCLTSALFLGYLKSKFVLVKSVTRQVQRILSLPNPAHVKYLYSKAYYLLIAAMLLLGLLLRLLPITLDTRGFVDMIIGAALMNGAMLYHRLFFRLQKSNV